MKNLFKTVKENLPAIFTWLAVLFLILSSISKDNSNLVAALACLTCSLSISFGRRCEILEERVYMLERKIILSKNDEVS